MSDVKFIRKNGRIIPIRQKNKEPVADYKVTAALGATSGVAAVTGGFAMGVEKATRSARVSKVASRFGLGGLAVAVLSGYGSLVSGAYQTSKFEDKGFVERTKVDLKQLGTALGSSVVGSLGAAAVYMGAGGAMAAVNKYRKYASSKLPKQLRAVPKIVKIIK